MSVPELQGIAGSQPDEKNPNGKSISINDVVRRVKCEIRDSIADRVGPRYVWFNNWTAQADLTLVVNEQSGISPGATFTQPLTLGSVLGRVTNMSRSVSLGLGGGVNTTAMRSEIVSFSISMKEIRDQFRTMNEFQLYRECHPHSYIDLNSNLGLKEWVDSALGPVENNILTEGYHKPPKRPGGGGGTAAGGGGAKPQALREGLAYGDTLMDLSDLLDDTDPLKEKVDLIRFEYQILAGLGDLLRIIQSGTDTPPFSTDAFNKKLTSNVEDIAAMEDVRKRKGLLSRLVDYAAITAAFRRVGGTFSEQQLATLKALVQKSVVSVEKQLVKDIPPVIAALQLICDCRPLTEEHPADQKPVDNAGGQNAADKKTSAQKANETFSNGLKCLKTMLSEVQADIPAGPAPKDPPIDAISHQVQFVIAVNASANPTWTLVHFKGPTPTSGSFASLSGTNTHTLTIVMGEPGSAAVANSRGSLTLSSALANQLIPSLQQGAPAPFVP
jgi:hypothetical protein